MVRPKVRASADLEAGPSSSVVTSSSNASDLPTDTITPSPPQQAFNQPEFPTAVWGGRVRERIPVDDAFSVPEYHTMVRRRVRPSEDFEAAPSTSVQEPSTILLTPPPYRTGECENEMLQKVFQGKEGQCLLLASRTRKGDYEAVVVPVYRPSIAWAKSMAPVKPRRKKGKQPLLPTSKSRSPRVERWWEIRGENRGESEEQIWKRVKEFSVKQQPLWRRLAPFYRLITLEERNLSLLGRKGEAFQVEVQGHDTEALRKNIQEKHNYAQTEALQAEAECRWERDHFGGIVMRGHSDMCRRGTAAEHCDPRDGSVIWLGCDSERFEKARLRLKASRRYERRDFLRCFQDPTKAEPITPLTQGRLFESCIHDGDMQDMELEGSDALPEKLGLYIEYRFSMEKHEIILASVACFVLALGLLSKVTTANAAVGAVLGTLFGAVVTTLINQMSQWYKDSQAKEVVKTTKKD